MPKKQKTPIIKKDKIIMVADFKKNVKKPLVNSKKIDIEF